MARIGHDHSSGKVCRTWRFLGHVTGFPLTRTPETGREQMVSKKIAAKKSRTRVSNLLASLVLVSAAGTAYLGLDSVFAGSASPEEVAALSASNALTMPNVPVSLPMQGTVEPKDNTETSTEAGDVAEAKPAEAQALTDKWALQFSIDLLDKGIATLKEVDAYTCTFQRQERVDGDLLDRQTIAIKLKHDPMSVYMKWTEGDRGRQAIYVAGQHDNKLLVQLGGIKGRLLGTLALEPTDSMVMAESRYPVTEIGLLKLAEKVVASQRTDLERGTGFTCQVHDNQTFAERPCYMLVIEYASSDINADYRKSVVLIDKGLQVPVGIRNYTWVKDATPENIDEISLVESYAYSEIDIETDLIAADFEKATYRIR
ncbi:MAG: DUF1571 domain-containing protein [Planctomycetaceae bacterium]